MLHRPFAFVHIAFVRIAVVHTVLALLSLMLAACMVPIVQPNGPASTPMPGQISATVQSPEKPYPQTFTDALGREVMIQARPQAIVSLSPSVTEILFAIGAGPQVIGRTRFDNYPSQVESLPSVGGFTAESISIETIIDLEPDLVIAGSGRQLAIADSLAQVGIPVFVLAPQSLADITAAILSLGAITGNADAAQTVVEDMEARIAAVSTKLEAIPLDQRVTVFYEVWHDPLTTTTKATYIGELLALAGGINIFADLEGTYPNVSDEQILVLDPQIIVGPESNRDQLSPAMLATRPGWSDLVAIQNGAVYLIDGDIISRPGPRVVDALEWLAAHFYPALFAE